MSATFFEGPLLSWLVTYWVHSSLLLACVWCLFARTSIGSLRSREIVWKTALVGGLVTASIQTGLGFAPLAGRWALPLRTAEVRIIEAPIPDLALEPRSEALATDLDLSTFTEVDAPVPQTSSVYDATSGTNGTGATSPLFAFTDPDRLATWGRYGLILWAVIAGACLLAMGMAWRRLSRSLAGKKRVHAGPLPGLLGMLRNQGNVRRQVRLFTSNELTSPLAMGWVLPQICVPERIQELPRDMQESILAHELAHIARFDPLWLIAARTLELAFFFQPLNRVARRQIQQSAELLCDDWAIERTKRPIVLARSLAEVAGWLLGAQTDLACAMVSQSATLSERVTRLLNERKPDTRSPWSLPAGALLLGATALLAPGFADQRDSVDMQLVPFAGDLGSTGLLGGRLPESTPVVDGALDPGDSLRELARALALELDETTLAVEALRRRAEQGAITGSLVKRIDVLSRRTLELGQRKERMDELIAQWHSLRSARVQATLTQTETSQ